jgi:hypothetical protein
MLPKYDDFFDIGEREILSRNPDIDPEEVRRPGSDSNIIVASAAAMADQVARQAEGGLANLYFLTAKGDALSEYAYDRYGLVKFDASTSNGHLTYYRNDTSYGAVTIERLAEAMDDENRLYQGIEAVGLTGNGPVNVRAVSKLAGALANARAGTISRVASTLDDANVKVTNAPGLVKFTRGAAGDSGTIPAGTQLRDVYGAVCETTEDLAFSASQTVGLVPVERQAQSGYEAPFEADTITTIVDDLFDTFSVTNPVKTGGAFSGGDDDETDGNFRQRCRSYERAVQRGNDHALNYGARTIEGVRHVQVFEDQSVEGYPGRAMHVLVADRNGIGSDALVALVKSELEEYSKTGVYVYVTGGEQEEVDVTVTLYLMQGADPDVVSAQAENIIRGYLNERPPSSGSSEPENEGVVEHAEIVKRLKAIDKIFVPHNAVSSPSSDYYPTRGKSARPGTITVNLES